MAKSIEQTILDINWSELRLQKMALIIAAENAKPKQKERFQGLINMIDSIQDSVVGNGHATALEVFAFEV